MSPMDEDELRALLHDVRPPDTTGAAATAVARGTRTRTRRRVGVAAVTAIALAGAGLTGFELTHRPQPQPAIQVTLTPTPRVPTTSPTPLGAVAAANLPTATDLAPLATSTYPLGRPQDHPAGTWGSTRVSLCQPHPNLGESSLLVREFPTAHALVAVVGFDTPRQASSARATILGWYRTCGSATRGAQPSTWTGKNLPLPRGGVVDQSATAAEATIPPDATGNAWWEEASIVQAGNRLAWVVQGAHGQDYECSLLPSDVVGQCGTYASSDAIVKRLLR